jgi:GNAT superfamily N-acetyltransferase
MMTIAYREMTAGDAGKLSEIDRSEEVDMQFKMEEHELKEIATQFVCPAWDQQELNDLQERFLFELHNGGLCVGAFDGEKLAGFGVLAHQWRGEDSDRLQVDLMYVSRDYRRKGIGSRIVALLSDEARRRGAAYLYISSTETRSAVSFYRHHGSYIAGVVDEELYRKEPNDIHMLIRL